jgi:hypothetical protein
MVMKTITARTAILGACLLTVSTGLALAQPPNRTVTTAQKIRPAPKVISRARQPNGAPHAASSFAPHPTHQRVFGAPIQPPIMHSAPPKKPNRK